jgi:hypothetical protein
MKIQIEQLHKHLSAYYSHTGRPSINPELIIRKSTGWALLHKSLPWLHTLAKADD